MSTTRYDLDIASNKEALKIIANTVNKKLQSKLNKAQISDLLQFVRSQRSKNWMGMSTGEICQTVARTYLSSRFTDEGRANLDLDMLDIHEIMKAHVGTGDQDADLDQAANVNENGTPLAAVAAQGNVDGSVVAAVAIPTDLGSISNLRNVERVQAITQLGNIQGFLGKTDEVSIQQMFNPQAAYRKNYIVLDSRYRDTSQDSSSDGFSSMSWVFLANSASATMGGVNSLGDVEQVVAMTTGDIRLPYQNNAMINSYRRISMNINEWSGQSFIGQEGRKFHFLFKATIDGNMIDCTALSDSATHFEFARPITQLDRITVTFGCPLEPVTFDMDRQNMQVQYGAAARFTSARPHNLQTGDQVYISGFTSADPAADNAIITQVNNPVGYNVVVISPTTLEIGELNLTTVTAPINPLNVPVYFGSKRIFLPLELTYIAKAQKKPS